MHLMVLDHDGNFALVLLAEVQRSITRDCAGIKVWETGEVVKMPPEGTVWPVTAPLARPLLAYTTWGYSVYGSRAIEWNLGFETDTGFSVPQRRVVDAAYVRVNSVRE
jgi:hypothetical protein